MSYLCENGAEGIQGGDGYVAQEDAKCKKSPTRQWTMPTRLTLKRLWGSRLSILCLLGDQWKALILPDSPPTDRPTDRPTYAVRKKFTPAGDGGSGR